MGLHDSFLVSLKGQVEIFRRYSFVEERNPEGKVDGGAARVERSMIQIPRIWRQSPSDGKHCVWHSLGKIYVHSLPELKPIYRLRVFNFLSSGYVFLISLRLQHPIIHLAFLVGHLIGISSLLWPKQSPQFPSLTWLSSVFSISVNGTTIYWSQKLTSFSWLLLCSHPPHLIHYQVL